MGTQSQNNQLAEAAARAQATPPDQRNPALAYQDHASFKERMVLGFMFDPTFQYVVLIKKDTLDKPGQEWQHGHLNGVGGKVKLGEWIKDAMSREFCEETGIITNPEQWMECGEITNHASYVVTCFMCVESLEVVQSARQQPGEKEVPSAYYCALVKNRYYNLARDCMELMMMCRWAYDNTKDERTFHRFVLITD